MWPILPLKNRSQTNSEGFWVLGLIADYTETKRFEVVLCTLFDLPEGLVTYDEFYQCAPTKVYADYEAMLDDGWVVD
jgi:hypothetical protein